MAKSKRKPSAPENETKADKFRRLASKRVTKCLNALRQVGQLSGPGYESSPEQVEKIFTAIGNAANEAMQKFQNKGAAKAKAQFEI